MSCCALVSLCMGFNGKPKGKPTCPKTHTDTQTHRHTDTQTHSFTPTNGYKIGLYTGRTKRPVDVDVLEIGFESCTSGFKSSSGQSKTGKPSDPRKVSALAKKKLPNFLYATTAVTGSPLQKMLVVSLETATFWRFQHEKLRTPCIKMA